MMLCRSTWLSGRCPHFTVILTIACIVSLTPCTCTTGGVRTLSTRLWIFHGFSFERFFIGFIDKSMNETGGRWLLALVVGVSKTGSQVLPSVMLG